MKLALWLLVTLSTTFASAQNDLRDAFQREHSFLILQKENLIRQKSEGEKRHQNQLQALKKELMALDKKSLALTSGNDAIFQKIQDLQQEKKSQLTRETSLLMTLKKAKQKLKEVEHALHFENAKKVEPELPETVNLAVLGDLIQSSVQLLQRSTQTEDFKAGYKTQSGQLTEGLVRRYGRGAAHVIDGSEIQVLGPDGKGLLQVVDVVQAGSSILPVYVFENLSQVAVVKKAATWTESIAGAVPAVFLLLMFAMVAGLFAVFVRE